jgi:hypothetical protein
MGHGPRWNQQLRSPQLRMELHELFDLGLHIADGEDVPVTSELLFDGALLIVLPLASSPHASIQLQMTPTMILGAWDDKHYIWDSTSEGEEPLGYLDPPLPA